MGGADGGAAAAAGVDDAGAVEGARSRRVGRASAGTAPTRFALQHVVLHCSVLCNDATLQRTVHRCNVPVQLLAQRWRQNELIRSIFELVGIADGAADGAADALAGTVSACLPIQQSAPLEAQPYGRCP